MGVASVVGVAGGVGVMVLFRIGRAFYVFERAIMEDKGLKK